MQVFNKRSKVKACGQKSKKVKYYFQNPEDEKYTLGSGSVLDDISYYDAILLSQLK